MEHGPLGQLDAGGAEIRKRGVTMLHYFIQLNFATVMLLICLLVFVNTTYFMDRLVVRIFSTAVAMLFVLVLVDSVEYWCASLAEPTTLRVLMSAIGYSLRPAIVFVILSIVLRYNRRKMLLWGIPLAVNLLVSFSAFFTDLAYSYDGANEFVRGPLGYCPFVVSGFYLVLMVVMTVRLYKSGNRSESMITVAATVLLTQAVAMESLWGFDGVINVSGAIMLVFYYIYLVTQQFKRDPLTGAFNRRSFYADAEVHDGDITAVLSIDLNNLKWINDNGGHAEGDLAIRTVADMVRSALPDNCFLYRTGGDEFMAICFDTEEGAVRETVEKIYTGMEKTRYRCAVGMAFRHKAENFEAMCRIADDAMYEDKKRLKIAQGLKPEVR